MKLLEKVIYLYSDFSLMTLSKKFLYGFITCVFLFALLNSIVFGNTPRSTPICDITIQDAYYIDNDIFTHLDVLLETGAPLEKYFLYLELENPLGETVSFTLKVSTPDSLIRLEVSFYNYATVSGDYKIFATVIYNTCGWISTTDVMIFDPPGSNEGDPWIGVTLLP